jgi:hypothetical protein
LILAHHLLLLPISVLSLLPWKKDASDVRGVQNYDETILWIIYLKEKVAKHPKREWNTKRGSQLLCKKHLNSQTWQFT